MATSAHTSVRQDSTASESWQTGVSRVTEPRTIGNEEVCHFVEASGDDNPIHLRDEVARAIPRFGLTGRVVHGKLVQSVAIDLLRREEQYHDPTLLPIILAETWRFKTPVYPGEEVRVRYRRDAAILRENRPVTFTLSVFVLRNETEIVVQLGEVTALVARAI